MQDSTTQLNIIVSLNDKLQPPGSLIHRITLAHFASEHFATYAAHRMVDESLMCDISRELTRHLRNESIRKQCGFSEIVAALCVDARGAPTSDNSQSNVVLFNIQIHDSK